MSANIALRFGVGHALAQPLNGRALGVFELPQDLALNLRRDLGELYGGHCGPLCMEPF